VWVNADVLDTKESCQSSLMGGAVKEREY